MVPISTADEMCDGVMNNEHVRTPAQIVDNGARRNLASHAAQAHTRNFTFH